jgi:hypothetical protein
VCGEGQVCHSFVLLGMITTIYACIAVEMFKDVSEEQDVRAPAEIPRGRAARELLRLTRPASRLAVYPRIGGRLRPSRLRTP